MVVHKATIVHIVRVLCMGGGKASCPWKDKSGAEAKKGANNFMVRMAEGGNTLTPPPP